VIDDPSGDVENILKHFYDLRSKAAHGVNAQAAEFIKVAPRARKLLAKVHLFNCEPY